MSSPLSKEIEGRLVWVMRHLAPAVLIGLGVVLLARYSANPAAVSDPAFWFGVFLVLHFATSHYEVTTNQHFGLLSAAIELLDMLLLCVMFVFLGLLLDGRHFNLTGFYATLAVAFLLPVIRGVCLGSTGRQWFDCAATLAVVVSAIGAVTEVISDWILLMSMFALLGLYFVLAVKRALGNARGTA